MKKLLCSMVLTIAVLGMASFANAISTANEVHYFDLDDIKDRDGNEVSIDFANISHIGYNVAWEDYPEEKAIQHREVETFEVSDDGGLKSMGNRRITEIVQ